MFFEDLELPDLVKKSLKETFAVDLQRAGYTVTGNPANLSIRRTMRNSMARRISLRRPKPRELAAIREAIEEARARGAEEDADRLTREFERLEHRSKIIPYIDPLDVRYNRFRARTSAKHRGGDVLPDGRVRIDDRGNERPRQAVLMLLHVFLIRRYRHVDVVFIRHTSTAEEVDEERPSFTVGKPAERWFRQHLKKCWRLRERDTPPIAGISTPHRLLTATITGPTAAAASPCWVGKCSRCANISPMWRSATGWAAASPGCRATAICGEPTARSRPPTRTSRCVGLVTRRKFFRCSTNCLRKGVSVPDTHLTEAARLEAAVPLFSGPNWDFTGLRKVYDGVERIASTISASTSTPSKSRVITSEQMLDAYARSACR